MKGIIIAAGYGSRFLPVTKTIPKEMLPLIHKPSIDFIVEEFIASGIQDILVITSRRKKSLEDYLDREVELEEVFRQEGKSALLEKITPPRANIAFIRQKSMMGTGHALLMARPWVGQDPVVVAYPDDLHLGQVPLAGQLIQEHEKTGESVLATIHNPPHLERYGVLDLAPDGHHVQGFVEKPAPGTEPSKEVSIGRFLFTPDFFTYLEEGWAKHQGGEYYHVYALEQLMKAGKVVHHPIEGERLDTGEPAGYLQAILTYATRDPELKEVLFQHYKRIFS